MRILLIQLYTGKNIDPVYPLGLAGLAYLSDALKEHIVEILDQNLYGQNFINATKKNFYLFNRMS
jgi:hypothetical protein